MRFCIIDASNLVHRLKHGVSSQPFVPAVYDPWGELKKEMASRKGLILHSIFSNIMFVFRKFNSDHLVLAFDKKSWRKEFHPEYKAHREQRLKTPEEQEDQRMIFALIDELRDFIGKSTNCTMLEMHGAEADDLISRWVQLHGEPCFEHIIVSTDGDFKQLISGNVVLFNPLTKHLYSADGVFFQKGRGNKSVSLGEVEIYGEEWEIKEGKDGSPETIDPEWELFQKCIRGDVSDNIKSAYPRVTTKRMKAAYEGNVEEWNNFINSQWGDDEENSVRTLYERNKTLIDLKRQPQAIIDCMDENIYNALSRPSRKFIGAKFTGFCSKHNLKKLNNQTENFARILSMGY